MARTSDFDILFDRLEAAITKSRAMKLKRVNHLLLGAIVEATEDLRHALLRQRGHPLLTSRPT
jgi:hypothetical protein